MKELKPHKDHGPDFVLTCNMKMCRNSTDAARYIVPEEGSVPMERKKANLVFSIKKSDKEIALNYRPMSLTIMVRATRKTV